MKGTCLLKTLVHQMIRKQSLTLYVCHLEVNPETQAFHQKTTWYSPKPNSRCSRASNCQTPQGSSKQREIPWTTWQLSSFQIGIRKGSDKQMWQCLRGDKSRRKLRKGSNLSKCSSTHHSHLRTPTQSHKCTSSLPSAASKPFPIGSPSVATNPCISTTWSQLGKSLFNNNKVHGDSKVWRNLELDIETSDEEQLE